MMQLQPQASGGGPSLNLERRTLCFPYCWVCGTRFKSSVPPGPAIKHEHHIFPRNAGGDDGPLVTLCDTHHSTLHRIAERFHRSVLPGELLSGEDTTRANRLLWLAKACYEAERLAANDPNKRKGLSVDFSNEELALLDRLRTLHGGVSRKQVLLLGMAALAKAVSQR